MKNQATKKNAITLIVALLSCACSAEPLEQNDALEARADEDALDDDAIDPAMLDGEPVQKVLFPTGHTCSLQQRNAITSAETKARQYLESINANAFSLMFFSTPGSRAIIQNHFAPANAAETQFIFDTYAKILTKLTATNYVCRIQTHVDCGSGTIARTTKTGTTTTICPLFFNLLESSRAQNIIHELSHQNRTSPNGVGTDDLGTLASIHNAQMYAQYSPKCFEGTCLPF